MSILSKIHKRINLYLVNKVYAGTRPQFFEKKRKLLNAIGFEIGEGTKIVGPIECYAKLKIGKNCWIGKNLIVNGNGTLIIGDNCDIAPEVTFLTGGHQIGEGARRAGKGESYTIRVGSGVWICGRSTIAKNVIIGNSSVIAAAACVVTDVADNVVVGGVPAKFIKNLMTITGQS